MARLFSILGDSVSTFEGCNPNGYAVYYQAPQTEKTGVLQPQDTWWHQVIEHFGGTLLVNDSFSGSMVEGAGFPAAQSDERVAALALDGRVPTDIIIFMGINDYGWGGPVAQAAGRSEAVPKDMPFVEPAIAGKADAHAAVNFGKAYACLLDKIAAAYPQAAVWCCTLVPGYEEKRGASTFTYRLRGVDFDEYCNEIRHAAQKHKAAVVDLRSLELDYQAVDGTHPTKLGMQQIAGMITYCMQQACAAEQTTKNEGGAVSDQPDATLFARAIPSQPPCPQPGCYDCDYARNTGNAWSCICDK